MALHSAGAVVKSTGLPHNTLNVWAARGVLDGLDAARTPAAKHRRFSYRDAVALALARELTLNGFKPRHAVEIALRGLSPAAAAQHRFLVVYRDRYGFEWRFEQSLTDVDRFIADRASHAPDVPFRSALVLDIEAIAREVRNNLEPAA